MMDEAQWLSEYFEQYRTLLQGAEVYPRLIALKQLMVATHRAGGKVVFAGNGGSAAIASHCAVDFTKNAGIRCINFNEADLITCFANDFGYERWLEKALEFYVDNRDLVILISSSGQSPNLLNAARFARARGLTVVTLTGFEADNPLNSLGSLTFWVKSRAYNIIEMMHQMWLLAVCDLIIGRAEYPARGAEVSRKPPSARVRAPRTTARQLPVKATALS